MTGYKHDQVKPTQVQRESGKVDFFLITIFITFKCVFFQTTEIYDRRKESIYNFILRTSIQEMTHCLFTQMLVCVCVCVCVNYYYLLDFYVGS